MTCSCDRRGMWDRIVSIGQTSNANSGLSILEPPMELIIEYCTGKCNHSISNEMVRCPHHDLNSQQRVHIFYTGLYIPTRIMLDSKGFIPLMTPTQALKSIQIMVDHSRNWYDEATTKERIKGSSDDIDIKQLDENIHVFLVSSKICEGMHLTEECTLQKEDTAVEQNKYMRSLEETIIKFYEESIKEHVADDEWIRKFIENTDSNIRALKTTTKNL
ncbi:hypothetical protein Tco_1200436 [Tanacetum coccineum]